MVNHRVVSGLPTFQKPRLFNRRMAKDEVDHDFEISGVGFFDEWVKCLVRSKHGVYDTMVGDVVAEVVQWGTEKKGGTQIAVMSRSAK